MQSVTPENMRHGKPCPKGHGTLRYKSNAGCVECQREISARRYTVFGDKYRARRRALYATAGGKEDRRARNLKKNYGLTLQQYEWMETLQRNRCAICDNEEPKGKLNVDHCHRTGKVRRLLCVGCNLGLGAFRDNPKLMRAAIAYLKENGV